jgi:hypothetical protein
MNKELITKWFELHSEEYLNFKEVLGPKSTRPDVHAFLLLDELIVSNEYGRCILSGSVHEKIYLDVDIEEISSFLTESLVIELIRSGVCLEDENLFMHI